MEEMHYYRERWYAENAPLGKLLGYPECCIKAFCDQPPELLLQTKRTDDDLLRYQAGCINNQFTGFIPCITHAKEIATGKTTLAQLIQNRDARFPPFPNYALQQPAKNSRHLFLLLLLSLFTGMIIGYKTKQV